MQCSSLARGGEAAAHAFPCPHDLPIPLGYWLVGAGVAVGLSFLAAAGRIRQPRRTWERAFALPPVATDIWLVILQ
jgi:hypothetical protein